VTVLKWCGSKRIFGFPDARKGAPELSTSDTALIASG
jgi:hypothetical protein